MSGQWAVLYLLFSLTFGLVRTDKCSNILGSDAAVNTDTINQLANARRCKRGDVILEGGYKANIMTSIVSAEEYQQVFITICCTVSATALLVYEYLITFDREYQLVWKRPFSAATLLFLLARYPILVEYILDLPTIYPVSSTSCSALIWLQVPLDIVFLLLVAASSGLRVYALSGRRWQIALLVFVMSLVPVGIALFLYLQQVVVVAPPPITCTSFYLVSPELTNTLTYVLRATTITADAIALAVTVHQTYWRSRGAAEANLRAPFHTLILRDGTTYFSALLMLNIADIILKYLDETFEDTSYIALFINPMTTIVISRFMLNLREVEASQCGTEDTSRPSFIGSIQFATFVEPIGAPLEHEFSFSPIDLGSLDEEKPSEDCEREDVLDRDEEMTSGQISIRGSTEAEPCPSRLRE